ncbi:hypothetical protein JCM1841_004094 [Sporobolomyces salmonicolor]
METVVPHAQEEGTSSLIGVGLALLSGCTISAGLNVERLAHLRRAHPSERGPHSHPHDHHPHDDRTPLLRAPHPNIPRSVSNPEMDTFLVPVEPARHHHHRHQPAVSSSRRRKASPARRPRTDKGFLRSPLWLGGFVLINVGEFINFLAYGFAPTSVVAPLGMSALVANVFLSPLIVGEPFCKKDLIGIAISILGGATVVYASRSNDRKPTPDEFLEAIARPLFIAYAVVSCAAMAVLAYFSNTRWGDRFVLVDLSLCALAGAFTVLSTKALSSFLNLMFLDTFRHFITYPVVFVLATTALLQVNFVNKSLQRFESRIVIPTQYMTFALSSIIGSAILYRDFEGVPLPSFINFCFGCSISAGGVYLLTRDPEPSPSPNPPTAVAPASSSASQDPSSLAKPPALPVHGRLVPVAAQPSLRARKLSVTLGGGYLLASSPDLASPRRSEPFAFERGAGAGLALDEEAEVGEGGT